MSAMAAADALTQYSNAEGVTREQALGLYSSIDWASYGRVGLLNSSDVSAISEGEKNNVVGSGGVEEGYVRSLMKVVGSVSEVAAQQYALTRLSDVLTEESAAWYDCEALSKVSRSAEDAYVVKTASVVLATVLTMRDDDPPSVMEDFVAWICEQLSAKKKIEAAVPALAVLLRVDRARSLFAAHDGVKFLTTLLKHRENVQTQYELTFCLWTLSFSEAEAVLATGSVEALVNQIAAAPREKVVRVSLAALRNLVSESDGDERGVAARMIKCGLPKTLRTLRERPFTDPEITDDVEKLHKLLLSNYRELSSWEKYVAQVDSGDLDWGLTHSEAFWKENARLAETDDFSVVKKLVSLLGTTNPTVVAVSCYDLGEFVRFYPNGKTVLKHIGAKNKLLALIEHSDPDVQRHALQCVSKMLVTNWEFVTS